MEYLQGDITSDTPAHLISYSEQQKPQTVLSYHPFSVDVLQCTFKCYCFSNQNWWEDVCQMSSSMQSDTVIYTAHIRMHNKCYIAWVPINTSKQECSDQSFILSIW